MVNPALLKLAQNRVWVETGNLREKVAVVPPGGGAGAGGGGGAMPPDPSMMGGAPPGGAPPMDPSMMGMGMPGMGAPTDPSGGSGAMPMPGMGMPGMGMPGMMPGMPGGQGMPGQKIKPEQMMQMLDFRMYNLQQQLTAIMNAMDIKLPPGALILPPGSVMAPPAEAALPGGPQDPGGQTAGASGGGQSAIKPIEPMQGASPELAAGGGGGGPKQAYDLGKDSFAHLIEKMAEEGGRHSSPPQPLKGPHPGKRPSTQGLSAGGSKDPLSRTEASADMGAVNKTAAQLFAEGLADPQRAESYIGDPYTVMQEFAPVSNAAAVAALLRSKTNPRNAA